MSIRFWSREKGPSDDELTSDFTVIEKVGDLRVIRRPDPVASEKPESPPPVIRSITRRRVGSLLSRKPPLLVLGPVLPNWLRAESDVKLIRPTELPLLLNGFVPAKVARRLVVAVPEGQTLNHEVRSVLGKAQIRGIRVEPLAEAARDRWRLEQPRDVPSALDGHPFLSRIAARTLDLLCALVGSLLFLAVLPFVALAIWLDDGKPVFYVQERVGREGKTFTMLKFRTMRPDAESAGPAWAAADDSRVTRVGVVLRRYKIDELPQFINVLLGHMSMVGPRPERPGFVEMLGSEVPSYDLRHSVRPGVTGWGTVKVGYGNSIATKTLTHLYDLYHLRNRTVWFDFEIIVRSVLSLARPESSERFMLEGRVHPGAHDHRVLSSSEADRRSP